ncbi:MAG: hypothetical protein QM757_25475 [Paludibaculum sp.]
MLNPSAEEFQTTAVMINGSATPRITFAPYSIRSAFGPRMPARISRRCMTETSFGEAGSTVPSRFSMSRNTRLGCVGASSSGFTPPPVTRSIASFGRSQSFMPSNAIPIATARKTTKLRSIAMD